MMDERPHNGGAGVGVTHFPEATWRDSLVRRKLTRSRLWSGRLARRQHVSDDVQVAVVDLRLDAQDVTHQGVDVHRLEGPHLQVPVKRRPHRPEEGLHVHLLVVVAVLALVELNRKILQKDTQGRMT